MRFEEIVEVKDFGEIKTMDIEVEGKDHCYYADGILVSNSHSISYALLGQRTAYLKAHYPCEFFCSCLIHSRNCQKPLDEIRDIINEARLFNVQIVPPSINNLTSEFTITGQNKISYGIGHAKNIGIKSNLDVSIFRDVSSLDKFLETVITNKIPSRITEALIKIGTLDSLCQSRNFALSLYHYVRNLTGREVNFILQERKNGKGLLDLFYEMIKRGSSGPNKVCSNKNRIEYINTIVTDINDRIKKNVVDSSTQRAIDEEEIIGIALTASKCDDFKDDTSINCYEAFSEIEMKEMSVIAVVDRFKVFDKKNPKTPGEKIMIMSISDKTCCIEDIIVFNNELPQNMENGCIIKMVIKRGMGGWFIGSKINILDKKNEEKTPGNSQ